MRTITSLLFAILLWSSLLLVTSATAETGAPPEVECNGETRTGVNDFYGRVEYAVTYNRSAQRVCTVAKNIGERNRTFKYLVQVDSKRIVEGTAVELESGEKFRDVQTITEGIDATRDTHSVAVTAYNETSYFNFTQEIDARNESGVPTPHFENLTVKRNGTESGQPRLILDIENEGIRTYVPEAEVRTLQSDSRRLRGYISGSPGGRYSVRLSEANDAVIVGTVRLYGGKFNPGTKFDRVSFISYPNGTLETWEPEFGEIPTKREIEEREIYYENESAREQYLGPDVDPISKEASRLGAVIVVAVVVGGFWYWRRRKAS